MLRRLWDAYRRKLDIQLLWPSCKKRAAEVGSDIEVAREAFLLHALMDPAWVRLGEDEIRRQIRELT
jgi:hypothetical protein